MILSAATFRYSIAFSGNMPDTLIHHKAPITKRRSNGK